MFKSSNCYRSSILDRADSHCSSPTETCWISCSTAGSMDHTVCLKFYRTPRRRNWDKNFVTKLQQKYQRKVLKRKRIIGPDDLRWLNRKTYGWTKGQFSNKKIHLFILILVWLRNVESVSLTTEATFSDRRVNPIQVLNFRLKSVRSPGVWIKSQRSFVLRLMIQD